MAGRKRKKDSPDTLIDPAAFRDRLQEALDEAGYAKRGAEGKKPYDEFCERVGIDKGNLSKMLNRKEGIAGITADMAIRIARVLNVRLVWLLTGELPMSVGGEKEEMGRLVRRLLAAIPGLFPAGARAEIEEAIQNKLPEPHEPAGAGGPRPARKRGQ